jgi:DNA helicase-2/ATP-dependent DNA helicase PcrA
MNLKGLNQQQLLAVTAPLGPVLVLAGAGSGKTRVLTYRIAYIIEQNLIQPDKILALTFTNKAAKEMQSRVLKLLDNSQEDRVDNKLLIPTLGTFHSVCARLLRKEIHLLGYSPGFVIYDAEDQLKIIKEIWEDLGIDKRFPPALFRAYISSAKNNVQTPAEFSLGLEPFMHDLASQVYTRYQNYLFQQNGVDFDDLLLLMIKIFQARPEVLAKYQTLFQYILVDEYQDTNPAQYMFLSMLASHRNLFVVGDDAQSIYSFRGSTIANILNFESDYPDSLVIKLEQNYRSTKNILAVAESVISLNSEQKPKKLWTENHEGSKIIVRECDNERDEAAFVARTIVKKVSGESDLEEDFEDEPEPVQTFSILDQFLNKQKRQSGGRSFLGLPQLPSKHEPLSDFAVLYRTHAQSRALEEALIEAAIPYQIIGGVKFYERKEIKDMLAYLRLIQNFRDLVSLKRVINIPTRGIGDKSYQIIKQFMQPFFEQSKDAQDNNIELSKFRQEFPKISLPPKQMESAKQFFGLLESFTVLEKIEPLSGLMRLVYKKVGMDTWLDDGTDSGEARLENVQELFNVSAKYDHLPWQDGLEQFLEEVALVAEIDSMQDTKDVVTLMTLHSAKGLEFDNVFFVGLEEGILPHSRTLLSPVELAEEIRLAYVGITRARKQLYLLYARQRSLFGNTQPARPSRILQALPTHNLSSNNASFNLNDGEVSYEAMDF